MWENFPCSWCHTKGYHQQREHTLIANQHGGPWYQETFFLISWWSARATFFRPSAARQAHAFSPQRDALAPADRDVSSVEAVGCAMMREIKQRRCTNTSGVTKYEWERTRGIATCRPREKKPALKKALNLVESFKAGPPPLEAILVIFGRRALIFFCLKGLGKKWKMTPLLCACAVVITLETQKCRKRAPRSVEFNFFNNCDRHKRFSQTERRRADLQNVASDFLIFA